MGIQKNFGQRVKELRKRAKLTQSELANRCGKNMEMQRIGELERGERNATLETVEKLAKGLRCEPAELFLFKPDQVNRSMSVLDSRLLDLWKSADQEKKARIIRIVSEILP